MTLADLERSLLAAIAPHDLLAHPFYRAWSMGTLARSDLAAYADQYRHQVEALPALLHAAHESSDDSATRAALQRNLDEEEGRAGVAHAELWRRFGAAVGGAEERVEAHGETKESAAALTALVAEGEVAALAALWAYERQTAHVAGTKREGLEARYAVREVSFFALHEALDVAHAGDLLAALGRSLGDDTPASGDAVGEALVDRACNAAARSARAQWLFLDGVEARRTARAA